MNRDAKKKRTPFEAIDFVPGAKKTPKKIDGKELKAKLQLAYAGMLPGLKNKSQKAQRDPRNAPRNREGNKRQPGRGDRGLSKDAVARKDRPNNKRSQQDPIDE